MAGGEPAVSKAAYAQQFMFIGCERIKLREQVRMMLTYIIMYVIMRMGGGSMDYINATNARKDLFNLISNTNIDHVPVHISGPRGNAVLISEDDWNSIQETLYLHSVPGLAQSILEARAEPIEDGVEYDPDEEW